MSLLSSETTEVFSALMELNCVPEKLKVHKFHSSKIGIGRVAKQPSLVLRPEGSLPF